jgi:hypothetical protein
MDGIDSSRTGNHDLHGSTSGAPFVGSARQLFLSRQHLLLHLLSLTKQLAHVGRGVHRGKEGSSVPLGDYLFDKGRAEFPLEKRGRVAGVSGRFGEAVLVDFHTRKAVLPRWGNDA